MLYGSGKQLILQGGQMTAVLLLQGQRGRNEARKTKSPCEPLSCLHGVLPMRFQVCYSPTPTRELAVAASHVHGAVQGGGLLRRVSLGRSRTSCSPDGEPGGCRGQQALSSRWQESGHTRLQLPGTGMRGIQLLAAQRCNLPAFREF